MTTSLLILPQVIGTFLAADLVTGIVHWLEDVCPHRTLPISDESCLLPSSTPLEVRQLMNKIKLLFACLSLMFPLLLACGHFIAFATAN